MEVEVDATMEVEEMAETTIAYGSIVGPMVSVFIHERAALEKHRGIKMKQP